MNYWLVKSEPETYSWDTFVKKGRDHWDGVRNYQARNNLNSMQIGDWVLFYHSGDAREVVGLAEVVSSPYPDPTTDDKRWIVVDMIPKQALHKPVSLKTIKADPLLSDIALVRQSRLSVMPLSQNAFEHILALSEM